MSAQVGTFHTLKVMRLTGVGAYLDGQGQDILLPLRFLPKETKPGDFLEVFLYHDSESRIIATTQRPYGVLGDILMLKAVGHTPQGAFMDWGLMKDLFVPKSLQLEAMRDGGRYLVKIIKDPLTGRLVGTEKILPLLSNEHLEVREREEVDLIVYSRSELGYTVIVNNKYVGLLHYGDVFKELEKGERLKGFVKTVRPDQKLDIAAGQMGYSRIGPEAERILERLKEHGGYLPYHDKSDPEEIYSFFGMSKKTFKMAVGSLYKQHLIDLTQTGIRQCEES